MNLEAILRALGFDIQYCWDGIRGEDAQEYLSSRICRHFQCKARSNACFDHSNIPSWRERTWTLRMEEFEIMFMKLEIERYI